MFVREILTYFIDVFFASYCKEYIKQVRVFKVPIRYFTIVVHIQRVEDSHDNCICIPFLELRCLLEEFKTRMLLKQVYKHWLEVFRSNEVHTILCNDREQSLLRMHPLEVHILPKPVQNLPG